MTGRVIQQVTDFYDKDDAIVSQIPNDDTIPQWFEGQEIFRGVIDLTKASSKLKISVSGIASASIGGIITLAAFIDKNPNAYSTWAINTTGVSYGNISHTFVSEAVGKTGPVQVFIRVGLNDTSNNNYITLGGRNGNVQWGDTSRVTFTVEEIENNELSWAGKQTTDNLYPTVPDISHYLAIAPTGANPDANNIYTHQYHHHTRVIEWADRVWVAYTTAGRNEDQRGLNVAYQSSPKNSISFNHPIMPFPYVHPFDPEDKNNTGQSMMTRNFQIYNNRLFLVCGVDTIGPNNNFSGLALIAVELFPDGTSGVPFKISTQPYTSTTGWTPIYDNNLGAVLLEYSKIYGTWCGSSPYGTSQSDWIGWIKQGNLVVTEPTTFQIDNNPRNLVRLWRHISGNTSRNHNDRLWIQKSRDGGITWGGLRRTDIPNVAVSSGIRIADGRIALVGNLIGPNRDPLYLGIFEGGCLEDLYCVTQGLNNDPVYPGQYKHGAAAYPDIYEGSDNIWISYSNAKERIFVSKIPKNEI